MVSEGSKNQSRNIDIDSVQYQQWTQAKETERIGNELSTLRNILKEEQLARYRTHLEAEPPW
jgi:hypothetical protein